ISGVALLDLFFTLPIFGGMRFCILDHFVNLLFVEAAGRHNRNLLLTIGALITGGYVDDTVGIDIKGHFNLGNATRSRGNTIQNEATERTVILGKLALTLQNVNLYTRLAIAGR